MTNHIIITGTSRGLGEAIALNLLQSGNHLYCISRADNPLLTQIAKDRGIPLDYFKCDLNDSESIDPLFDRIFKKIDLTQAASISLINNAGVIEPVTTAGKYKSVTVSRNVHVNLIAPILTTDSFIRRTADLNAEKRIINISSGAANKAYHGWGAYCASKAGIDMFSACTNLEQKNQKYPVKITAIAPGIVDTDMQAQIRSANKNDFADIERFISFKKEGTLTPPDIAAKEIIKLLTTDKLD